MPLEMVQMHYGNEFYMFWPTRSGAPLDWRRSCRSAPSCRPALVSASSGANDGLASRLLSLQHSASPPPLVELASAPRKILLEIAHSIGISFGLERPSVCWPESKARSSVHERDSPRTGKLAAASLRTRDHDYATRLRVSRLRSFFHSLLAFRSARQLRPASGIEISNSSE